MAPSTVFSYLRRDHRRASSSLAPPSPSQTQAQPSSVAPQLPATFQIPKLGDEIFESRFWPESDGKSELIGGKVSHPENKDTSSPRDGGTPTGTDEPSAASQKPSKNNNTTSEGDGLDAIYTIGNSEELPAMGRSDQHHYNQYGNGFQKAASPWKRTLGKGFPPDGMKGGGGGNGSPSGLNGKSKNSPDTSATETKGYFWETKGESASSRRHHETINEPSYSKPSKTRLNLLNPMALLARRRSSQMVNTRPEDINISKLTVPALPDDYDPRIRGKLIHDFSVPRPRPTASGNNNNSPVPYQRVNGQDSSTSDKIVSTNPSENRPLFEEHIGTSPSKTQAKHTGDPTETTACSNSLIEREVTRPSFERKLPPIITGSNQKEQEPRISTPPSSLAHNESPPATLRSKAPTTRDPSHAPSGLPKHLTSSASRFSFDMAPGDSSSQEKFLEEKHKEKEAAKKAEADDDSGDGFDVDSDDFDYDAMMDDEGLEEMIPGVNADADIDIDGFSKRQQYLRRSINTFIPGLPTVLSSPVSPQDANSSTQPSPIIGQQPVTYPQTSNGLFPPPSVAPNNVHGSDRPLAPEPLSFQHQHPSGVGTQPHSKPIEDDDLYFDDGLFGDLPEDMQNSGFDESIFDDETSHLYDRMNRVKQQPLPIVPEDNSSLSDFEQKEKDKIQGHGHPSLIEPSPDRQTPPAENSHEEPYWDSDVLNGTVNPSNSVRLPSLGLTEGNLEAYHTALANAANEAARSGRFERKMSVSEISGEQEAGSQAADSHPGLTTDESRLSQTVDTMEFDQVFDDFNYDDGDGLDDDLIIAEANADVLENDDEGFYGEEFGFYAHSRENGNAERVYGGYFGNRGVEGPTRNQSGRKVFQEPSLTPITERSEWSTRNSIISLATHGAAHSNPSVSSPPLSQLVDMGSIEDEMSLSALLKLRRGAWGGSNGSLRSSAASQSTQSPPTHQPSSNYGSFSPVHDVALNTGRPRSMVNPAGGTEMNSPLSQTDGDHSPAGLTLRSDKSRRRKSDGSYPLLSLDSLKRNSFKSTEEEGRSYTPTSNSAFSANGTKDRETDYWAAEKSRMSGIGETRFLERD